MNPESSTFKRDLFEIENARNLTRDELVETFVPTRNFWRLLSSKNHIVLGSRGSGKTALAKMLAHDHLSSLKEERAQLAIKTKSFIGIYVPTKVEWVGGLKNKTWQSDQEKEEFFQWLLNISTCLSFLVTVQSCLSTYVLNKLERALAEEQLIMELSKAWSNSSLECKTIRALQRHLEDVLHAKQQQLARLRVCGHLQPGEEPVGLSFESELFVPLRRGITLVSRALDFPETCKWILCLDEAEFLEPLHHRILNTHMRASSGNLVYKITTMPYFHHTLDTNTCVPLNVGDDFEYVYIDQDPILSDVEKEGSGTKFALQLFAKRAENSLTKYRDITLDRLLGPSELLECKDNVWELDSRQMGLLKKYSSAQTYSRAMRLLNDKKKFSDEISRKLHGALLLREAVSLQKGRGEIDLYSGDLMAIRCGDANPRRLIRIFNSFLQKTSWAKNKPHKLTRKDQNRILTTFSVSTLSRVQSEADCGPQLYEFLETVGNYMHKNLHEEPVGTDQLSSIKIDKAISDKDWQLVKTAVGLGLLYPNISANNPDQMPHRNGIFHLAYVLAPYFRILPRRGKSILLSTALNKMRFRGDRMNLQQYLFTTVEDKGKTR